VRLPRPYDRLTFVHSNLILSNLRYDCASFITPFILLVTRYYYSFFIMRKRTLILIGLAAGAGAAVLIYRNWRHIVRHSLKLSPATHAIGIERNIPIEVEHGLTLAADHYYPKAEGRFPTILIRSPYGRELRGGPIGLVYGFLLRRLAERGYHVIAQDTRGRYESEGEFDPFVYEVWDGRTTLDWIKRQPWLDGTLGVGMTGPSYLGYTQYAAALEPARVPHLKAIMPIMTSSQFYTVIHPDGSFALDTVLHWLQITFLAGRPDRKRRFISPQEEDRRLARLFDHTPVQDIDELLLGERVDFYHEALTATDRNALRWRTVDLSDRLGNIEAAAHLMTGWHDFMLRELLADYQRLVNAGRNPYLTIGPWYHADVRYLEYAIRLSLEWFDAQLKGQRDRLRAKPVRLFLMGANEWRDFDAWPPKALRIRYYLREQRHLSIEPPQNGETPDRYHYDPADPTPNLGGPLINLPKGAVRDNRELEARSDVLVYTTPPLDRDLDVIGPIRLELFARSTLAHTDFFGRLCDVQPNGKSLNVCDGLIRVKPEGPVEHPEHNGRAKRCGADTLHLEIDLWATAHRFKRGHCLRLIVSSGAHPRWLRNYGTGEAIGTATEMRAADQTVFHDRDHSSALILPV
jgi:putative CocE/NonD family hydrolase